jgi:hypothetical protein
MNNKPYRRNFTPSDDALILEQPVTRIGLKTLATMLHTSHETLMRRADELGVSLAISLTRLSTRGAPSQRWTRRPATGTAEASTRRPEVNTNHDESGLIDFSDRRPAADSRPSVHFLDFKSLQLVKPKRRKELATPPSDDGSLISFRRTRPVKPICANQRTETIGAARRTSYCRPSCVDQFF